MRWESRNPGRDGERSATTCVGGKTAVAGSGARDSVDACTTTIMQYTGNAFMHVVAGKWCGVWVEGEGACTIQAHGARRGGLPLQSIPTWLSTVRFIYRLRGDVGEEVVERSNDN